MDEPYQNFLDLLNDQIRGIIGTVKSYELEKEKEKVLEEIDRTKTIFFTNASHEFRTPLTLMLGPLEDSLGKDDKTEPFTPIQRERQSLIYRNGLRLLKLVNSLLSLKNRFSEMPKY